MTKPNANLPANISNMATGLALSIASVSPSGGDQFMKMSKEGIFLYGAEEIEVEEGSTWAVNPAGFQHGFIAWGTVAHGTDGQMLGEHMGPAGRPIFDSADLEDVNGNWSPQVGIQLRCTDGEDEGTQCLYKTNSVGGRKAYTVLVQKVVAKINSGTDEVVPLVRLNAGSYKHAKYGKIYTPEFIITGWTTMDNMPVAPEPEAETPEVPEPAPEPQKPKRARKAAKAEEPEIAEGELVEDEPEAAPAAPARRSRRTIAA